jgi:signal transduction histidine kinase
MTPDGPCSNVHAQIVASLNSGVIAVDARGGILTANDAAGRHLGMDTDGLRPGAPLADFEALQPLQAAFEEIRDTQQPLLRREITVETAGQPRVLGMTVSTLQGAEPFNGAIFLFTDLTEVRRLARAVDLSKQLAQIGELTAGVVHDLRNPLGVISCMAELLLRHLQERPTLARHAASIMQECAQLDKLITRFLHFAKPFELERAQCSPDEILDRALTLCHPLAREKNVRLTAQVEGELPTLSADGAKLAQALANLIRNALEATPAESAVCVRAACEDEWLVYRIEDEGPGVHVRAGEDLFAPFVSKKEGGTGLGLSIVHRIVTAHGGSITYANFPERGACFTVLLPIGPPLIH